MLIFTRVSITVKIETLLLPIRSIGRRRRKSANNETKGLVLRTRQDECRIYFVDLLAIPSSNSVNITLKTESFVAPAVS